MHKFAKLLVLFLMFFVTSCDTQERSGNAVYFFTQPGCIHCEHARDYINRYYPKHNIKELNVREQQNMGLLMHSVKKMKINSDSIGTPFIVIGDHYVMGWGNEQVKQFNQYIRKIKPRN